MKRSMYRSVCGYVLGELLVVAMVLSVGLVYVANTVWKDLKGDTEALDAAIKLSATMDPVEGARYIFITQRTAKCGLFCWMIDAPERARGVEFTLLRSALEKKDAGAYLLLFGELAPFKEYEPLVDEYLPKAIAMKSAKENESWLPSVQNMIVNAMYLRPKLQAAKA